MNSKLNRPTSKSARLAARAAISLIGAGIGLVACSVDSNAGDKSSGPAGTLYTVALPDGVSAGTAEAAAWEALMGIDGEYAAFAMYGAVIDEFGAVEPYVTIKQQEGHHVDALIRQLDRMRVAVPDNPYLGVAKAPADLEQAAQNWADGEVANVAMYDDLTADSTGDAQLARVFANLRRASADHHLPMFTAAAAAGGTLDEAAMSAFADDHERGAGGMHGSDETDDGEQHRDGQHGHRDQDQGSGNGPNIVDND